MNIALMHIVQFEIAAVSPLNFMKDVRRPTRYYFLT